MKAVATKKTVGYDHGEALRNYYSDPANRAKHKARYQDPDLLKKMSEIQKAHWQDPEYEQFRQRQFRNNPFFVTARPRPSRLELLLYCRLLSAHIYDFTPEFHIASESQHFFADVMVFPNLLVEADGTYWHSTAERHEYDRNRDSILEDMGWTVLRLSENELYVTNKPIIGSLKMWG